MGMCVCVRCRISRTDSQSKVCLLCLPLSQFVAIPAGQLMEDREEGNGQKESHLPTLIKSCQCHHQYPQSTLPPNPDVKVEAQVAM